jgi:hypothetical protein
MTPQVHIVTRPQNATRTVRQIYMNIPTSTFRHGPARFPETTVGLAARHVRAAMQCSGNAPPNLIGAR